MSTTKRLLINEPPLVVSPSLATLLGLNEAVVLQQIHYWISGTSSGITKDGGRWIYNTVEQWQKQFPFFTEATVRRTLESLRNQGVVRAERLAENKWEKVLYYTINYAKIDELQAEKATVESDGSKRQNCRIEASELPDRNVQIERIEACKLNASYTETTQETTTYIPDTTAQGQDKACVHAESEQEPTDYRGEVVPYAWPILGDEGVLSPEQGGFTTAELESLPLPPASRASTVSKQNQRRKELATSLIIAFYEEATGQEIGSLTPGTYTKNSQPAFNLLAIQVTPELVRLAVREARRQWPGQQGLSLSYIESNWPALAAKQPESVKYNRYEDPAYLAEQGRIAEQNMNEFKAWRAAGFPKDWVKGAE